VKVKAEAKVERSQVFHGRVLKKSSGIVKLKVEAQAERIHISP